MSDSIQNLSDDQRVELLAGHYKAILEILGENPDREGHVGAYIGLQEIARHDYQVGFV